MTIGFKQCQQIGLISIVFEIIYKACHLGKFCLDIMIVDSDCIGEDMIGIYYKEV